MENKELDDIVKDHVPRLHSFVRGRVSNRDDVEDIVQDTVYQFLRTISALENPISHVSSWLYTVAHNLIINHGKKHREASMSEHSSHVGREFPSRQDTFMQDISEIMMADDGDNPDIRMLRSMVWDDFDKALAELPEEQRLTVVMTEIQGLSVKDAAQQMGVTQNTFLSRKHYAIKHIRKRLHSLYLELLQK